MNVHEYQAKEVFRKYGIKVLDAFLIESMDDFEKYYPKINTKVAVLKAQVHAGGRRKAGGVRLIKSLD